MSRATLGFAIMALLAAGCEPRDVPCFSPDGKEVALLLTEKGGAPAKAGEEARAVGVVPVGGGARRDFPVPAGWTADGLIWTGGRLLVEVKRPLEEPRKGGPTVEAKYVTLDPVSGRSGETKISPHISFLPFAGRFKGKSCVYAPDMDTKSTKVFSMDDLAELGAFPFEAQGAGDGWFIRVARGNVTRPIIEGEHTGWILDSLPEEGRTVTREEMTSVEVFSLDGKKTCTIPREEIAKACYRSARQPLCARISADGRTFLLGFGTETNFRRHPCEYTFGVFDAGTGKFLWQGALNGLQGLPVIKADAVYILEAKSRKRYTGERTVAAFTEPVDSTSEPTDEAVLARHTAKGRTVVCELPLKEGDLAARYSCSPDRKSFVLLVEGKNPRLLLVPVKEKIAVDEVRAILLKPE